MEPRRPKHKQAPPLEVSQRELERALKDQRTYVFSSAEAERAAFPDGREDNSLRVVHTHMSMVFLLPNRVYKVKKQVDFGFVDFSTLYKRFQACFAEVQLNQRLAPDVYVGVVPVSMKRDTREMCVRCDDFWTPEKSSNLDWWLNDQFGEIVEWAVHMVRLSDDCTLLHHMDHGELTESILDQVADKLVEFHADARRGPKIDHFGKEPVIRHNIDENFHQTAAHTGMTVSEPVYRRVKELSYTWLKKLKRTFASRVENGYICDTHGDLRLEHVYRLPRASSKEAKLVILDCIEFNEQFRFGDPLSDVAFLSMDIWSKGRPDLARFLQQQYLLKAVQNSPDNANLYVFYTAYRAVVRAKVCGFRAMDPTLSAVTRVEEIQRAHCYWLVALELLSPAPQRPCMILVGGLPASGKSNLAKMLAEADNALVWLRSDAIRKEIAEQHAPANKNDEAGDSAATGEGNFEEGLYSPEMTQRTYDEILKLCVKHLRQGERVVVDATFRDPIQRQRFIAAARTEGALFAFIMCECDREIIKGRMLARKNDISDAAWEVYESMEKAWHFPERDTMVECSVVNTEKEKELSLRRAQLFLRKTGLL
uniref:Aminoglycoside phosphotransferase domain-containing protein n=1 Tax=Phytophthora ramorum TaxID=164328 RepID=H3GNZ7_PHYRM